ncbi:MAG TPA: hypothetical protein VF800_22860 [Telluria sp.]|jgi:hypothetical protein
MAGISISVQAGATVNSSAVQASGNVVHIITPTERSTFNIQDGSIKAAVARYFGEAPDDAYLCEPTPWGGLYNTYHWPQVQTTLVVQKAEILGITSEPVIIATSDFVNNSAYPGNFNCGITDDVTNTVETNWSESNTIDVNQTISYDVSFLGTGGGGSTSFDYSYSWGQGGSESKSMTVGSSQGVNVNLDPGQRVQARLTASRGVMQVRITYLASIAGTVAINYSDPYNGHHFWGLDLSGVMQAGGLATTHVVTEDIEIGYYSNAAIELVDLSGAVQKTVMAGRPVAAGASSNGLADEAVQAKRRTVDDLKAFEEAKDQARASLTSKLDNFKASLSDVEYNELSGLLEMGNAPAAATTMAPASAFLKPMQRAEAFLKPMQRAEAVTQPEAFLKPMQRAEAFLKPMQRAEAVTRPEAFLKPMQSPEAFLKPMQRAEAFLKPMQRAEAVTQPEAFLKPMQSPEAFLKPMQRAEAVPHTEAFLKPMQR